MKNKDKKKLIDRLTHLCEKEYDMFMFVGLRKLEDSEDEVKVASSFAIQGNFMMLMKIVEDQMVKYAISEGMKDGETVH